MLKLYTDKSFLNDLYRKQIFPLLFDLYFLKSETIQKFYKIVDTAEDSDVVVFPVDYGNFNKFQDSLYKLLDASKLNKKPLWIYTSGDFGYTVYISNTYNFRLGGFHSKLDRNTYVLPSFINDPLENLGLQELSLIDKTSKPSIGFVGHAQGGVLKWIKEYFNYKKLRWKRIFKKTYIDKQPFYPSSVKRAYYLDKFRLDKRIEANFIYRKKYRAGAVSGQNLIKSSREFYQNIHDNLYTFCIRGTGNFSVRFFETLAMGRIPVVLDTDCRLPFHNQIDWRKHCLIVKESNGSKIVDLLLEFHKSKSNTELEQIQRSNRLLWKEYLKREAYFIKVHNMFINRL
ncbi:exostosin domain-containing protein [Hyunsoonleella pacifica]|uniref:Exostosin GT47 domain-containing protein n=1 Tax=Hyunsoonleella pacifica TaxID=1080224 RepID=A0A4Q9FRG5_9FLAO|nr:exostosin family protein [Hyunsoonleella pacifica]TBN18523.1 hypothetical protein EYD46_00195 [Hyunsoonleella pacifica]GGD02509.1 hypothetical protein GCM10011368_00400 [Hyunsoonleella pacifica]